MKFRKYTLILMSLLLLLTACSAGKPDQEVLNLMTWGGDFVPREIINDFEEEYDIKVNYKEVSSNEEMQNLIQTSPSHYDLAVVTDYMVEIMVLNDNLEMLDPSRLENLKHIDENYQSKYYDLHNEFSIPYAVSIANLVVNDEKIADLGLDKISSYADLWQDELQDQLVVLDGAVELIGIVSKALGFEVNDPSKNDQVQEKLFDLRDKIVRFETNTPEDSLLNGEAAVGFMYSNQASKALAQDERLSHVFPKEGIPMYIDSFVMTKNATNTDNAYLFLDYIMRPEVSAKISEKTQFISVNKGALDYLSDEFKDNPLLNLPEEAASNTFFYTDLEKVLESYDQMYSEFKMQ